MSGGKDRVTFRVNSELKDQLDKDESLNTSGLLRDLLDNYLRMGDTVEASLQRRYKDKENELNNKQLEKRSLENDIEKLERDLERLEKKMEQRRNSTPEEVIEFAEKMKADKFHREQLEPENEALKNWAQKAGIPATKFIRQVEERL